MGWAFGAHGSKGWIQNLVGNAPGKYHWANRKGIGRIISRWVLRRWAVRMENGVGSGFCPLAGIGIVGF